ncbi:MAG: hypothetical protein WCQ72_06820 [Eubacteriales bacterium]
MKKIKHVNIKSFLLAMLMLLSLSTTIFATGENIEAEDSTIHDISCKFDCEHTYNPLTSQASNEVNIVTEEEMIALIAQESALSEDAARELINGLSEHSTANAGEYVEDSTIHDIDCKFDCEHSYDPIASQASNEVNIVTEEEMIALIAQESDLSEEQARDLINGISEGIDDEIQSLASCAHFFGPHICGTQSSKGNCMVICNGRVSCTICGMSFIQVQEHESHTWTNGCVCGKQCSSCGRVVYNPGHGPGSGHSWCTND